MVDRRNIEYRILNNEVEKTKYGRVFFLNFDI